jgi:hypothetical protein
MKDTNSSQTLARNRGAIRRSRRRFCKRCYGHARSEVGVILTDRFMVMVCSSGTAFGQ